MWMLNYPFPYEKAEVKRQFEIISRRLAQLLPGSRLLVGILGLTDHDRGDHAAGDRGKRR
jgi:hypothetical protein